MASTMQVQTSAPRAQWLRQRARWMFVEYGILPPIAVALFVAFAILEPRFASADNLITIVRQLSYMAIVVMGQTLYLLTGNYDLSNGANVALTSIVTVTVMNAVVPGLGVGVGVALACLAGLTVGLVVGALNGLIVAKFRLHSFIVTLGMASIVTGTALLLSKGAPVTGVPDSFTRTFGSGRLFGIPVPVIILIVVVAGMYVLLNRSKIGRRAYILGGNPEAARVAGIRVDRELLKLFVLGSALASLVGLMLVARVASGEANLGLQYPLLSIVAAVLGGVTLWGGEGRLSGALSGAFFIILLSNGMDLIRVQSFIQEIALGVLLIVALIVDQIRARLRLEYN